MALRSKIVSAGELAANRNNPRSRHTGPNREKTPLFGRRHTIEKLSRPHPGPSPLGEGAGIYTLEELTEW